MALMIALMISLVIAVGVVSNQMMQSTKLKRQIALSDQLESFGAMELAAWHMHYKQRNDASIVEGAAPVPVENQKTLNLTLVPTQTISTRYQGEPLNVSATRTLDTEGVFVRRPTGDPVLRKFISRAGASFFCGETASVKGKVGGVCLKPVGPPTPTGCTPIPECGIDICTGSLASQTAVGISTPDDFRNMSSGHRYRLTRNLDFGGGSVAIGSLEDVMIDGAGFEIRNVALSSSAPMGHLAMIASLNNAVIKNLKLKNISITAAPGSGVMMGGFAAEATGHICATQITLDNVSIRSSGDGNMSAFVSAGGLFGRIAPQIAREYRTLVNESPRCPPCPGPDPCPCAALPPPYYEPQKVALQDITAKVDIQDLRTRCYTGMAGSRDDERKQSTGGIVGTANSATSFKMARIRVEGTVKGGINVGGVVGRLAPSREDRTLGESQIEDVSLVNLTVEAPKSTCPSGAGTPEAFTHVGGVFGSQGFEGANGAFFTGSLKKVTATNLQVSGKDWVGGVFGGTWGHRYTIDDANIGVSVNATGAWATEGTRAGGIGGGGQVEVINSRAAVQVNGRGMLGGILGFWEAGSWNISTRGSGYWSPTLDNLSTSGNITLQASTRTTSNMVVGTPDIAAAGGIVGEVLSRVSNNTTIKATRLASTVKVFSAIQPVRSAGTDLGGSGRMGGLFGHLWVSGGRFNLENSFAAGDIDGTSEIGGLIGRLLNHSMWFTSINSFYSGKVTPNFSNTPARHGIGTLVGQVTGYPAANTFTSNYYDSQKNSAILPMQEFNQNFGSGVTTNQLKNRNTFVSWDFSAIWQPPTTSTPPTLR